MNVLGANQFYLIIVICALFVGVTFAFLFLAIYETAKKKRHFEQAVLKNVKSWIFSTLFIAAILYALYRIPDVLVHFPWYTIFVFGPISFFYALVSIAAAAVSFYLYFNYTNFFVKEGEKPFFKVIVLSIVSGAGNSVIVFTINEALNRSFGSSGYLAGIESQLYIFFILGMLLFVFSAVIVRKKLIEHTNELIYGIRVDLVSRILRSSYQKLETMEDGRIYAALNNDPETISGLVSMFVSLLTGTLTLITCFIYLGTLNFWGMLLAVFVIGIAVTLFQVATNSAQKYFEKNRNIQDVFFNNITDLVRGIKELSINSKKREAFQKTVVTNCAMYRDTRITGENKFVRVSILGEMMYFAVIGLILFLFPVFVNEIQNNILRNYILVILYMGGIVNSEIFLIPQLMRVVISWRKIKELKTDIMQMEYDSRETVAQPLEKHLYKLELKNIVYKYQSEKGEAFVLGPIDAVFQSGEITFISGGNGSGKSTLAKILTGLYHPLSGEIFLNGERIDFKLLGEHYTTIFSNYYLFDRLYGVDCSQKAGEIDQYLDKLKIKNKLTIDSNGICSTTMLSTGQRKRLALLISYLEDKPVFLFDEWAADQDPEYRKFFYLDLLPELKKKGKCVIAITHDEHYFHFADKHITMDLGKITKSVDKLTTGFMPENKN